MTEKSNFTTVEEWETLAVTPLPPGWVNVYADEDGGHHANASPAILLQRAETYVQSWDEQHPDDAGRVRHRWAAFRSLPAITRAVYADSANDGELFPANEASDYIGSMTRAEYRRRYGISGSTG